MFVGDIKRVVDQVSRDKGIDRDILIKALEEALRSAAKKKYGSKIDVEVHYNDELGEIEVFQFKEVVDEITEPDLHMTLDEGIKLDPECEIGDSLGTKMDTTDFGRIAAQSAKQVIIQKMKDAERDAVYANFIDRKNEIVHGIVQRFERGDMIVNLGQTEAVLPSREQAPRENYRRGDRIRALILDVKYEGRGPQVVLTRTHNTFLINLFKTEVPEIAEGIVSIMSAAREPGSRAKIAVASTDSDIDPVGACVGMKGSRVQNVVQELKGEKIDIIPWHVDAAKFVCNALAPADITRVIIDEDNKAMEVVVPDDSLSIAIGKRGQNVRLASKLTGWHLDVKSETKYNEAMEESYKVLISVPGISEDIAKLLHEKGLYSIDELVEEPAEIVAQLVGISEEDALELLETSKKFLNNEIEAQLPEGENTPENAEEKEFLESGPSESDQPDDVGETESASGEPFQTVDQSDDSGAESDLEQEATDEGEDQEATDEGEGEEATDEGEGQEATDEGEGEEATDEGEGQEATGEGEGQEATGEGEEAIDEGEGQEATDEGEEAGRQIASQAGFEPPDGSAGGPDMEPVEEKDNE